MVIVTALLGPSGEAQRQDLPQDCADLALALEQGFPQTQLDAF